MTGRPHIRAEMEKSFAGRMVNVWVCTTQGDIIEYRRGRLGEDEMPDAMNASLEAEILEKIPENNQKCAQGQLCSESHPTLSANRCL